MGAAFSRDKRRQHDPTAIFAAESFELQEFQSAYKALFDTEKIGIERKTEGFGVNKKGYRIVGLGDLLLRSV